MKALAPLMLALALAACDMGGSGTASLPDVPTGAAEMAFDHTKTLRVFERDDYRIVDLKASVVSWGGEAQGGEQAARIVLVPRGAAAPALTGDLEGAVLVRTPVERVAVNYGFLEAILGALDAKDRLVAVGGVKSYDDALRARARAGELGQIGYGWHSPPMIDPLLAAEPDVFFMVLGDLGHAEHYERIKALGVPVVPIFLEAEPGYLGPLDYVRLLGMFTGQESLAEAYVSDVVARVEQVKSLAAIRPPKTLINAWYAGSGRWMATVRNAENQLMSDAGAVNILAQEDDMRLDDMMRIGSETLLEKGRNADCWLIRDSHSDIIDDAGYLEQFKAWREGCLLAADGARKPAADAYDIYERGPIRPDLILQDWVSIIHPGLIDTPPTYIRPHRKAGDD